MLVGTLGATHVSVGENFRFGHKAQGDTDMLAADERFETRVVPLLEIDGEVVSSSHIRGLVLGGAVMYADRLLGAPFMVQGEVVHGDKRGRELGFPTANLVPRTGYVTPGHGVYACRTGDGHVAAVNVGVRPMFATGRGELIEAYLLDFDGDLYGTELRLEFLKRLRGEKRFASVDALVEQMHRGRRARRAGPRPSDCYPSPPHMTLTQERKAEITAQFGASPQDTGNTRVQVALLTERINELTEHLRDPQEGPSLTPRAADARRPSSPAPQLPAEEGPRGLPRAHP